MAVDMFLKLGDIEGESVDDKHKGEIDVLSFSWNLTRGRRGRAQVGDFSIVKRLDKATPLIIDALCSGDRLSEATLSARKAGGRPVEFLKIKFSDVFISSVAPAGGAASDVLMEQLALSFARSEVSYFPQKADGSLDSPVTSSCSPRSLSFKQDSE